MFRRICKLSITVIAILFCSSILAYDENDVISDSTIAFIGFKISQTLETDKRQHFIAGTLLSYSTTYFMKYRGYSQLQSVLSGWLVGAGAGLIKELYDQYSYGTFDKKDLTATAAGATLAQFRFIIQF